jgi:hypothetical protein
MLRFAADENFNAEILRALRRIQPDLDVLMVQEAGISGASDPEVLEWAANLIRVLLTHDVRTMRRFVIDRLQAKLPMPGVLQVPTLLPIGAAVQDILIVAICSADDDLIDQMVRLPL